MSKIVKARVMKGRYLGQVVRVTNVSTSTEGRKNAACFLPDGSRVNIPLEELEIIEEPPAPNSTEPERRPGASMPFMSGSTGSRTMNQSRSLAKPREKPVQPVIVKTVEPAVCETCGQEYNLAERRGQPGKLTQCEDCSVAT